MNNYLFQFDDSDLRCVCRQQLWNFLRNLSHVSLLELQKDLGNCTQDRTLLASVSAETTQYIF